MSATVSGTDVVMLFLMVFLFSAIVTMAATRVLRRWLDDIPEQEDTCSHEAFMDGRCMECGTPTDSIQVYRNTGGSK